MKISGFLLIILFGCGHINQASKDYYESKKMRHGIVPLPNTVVKKLEAASVDRGKAIYQKHCLGCHGKNGEGDGAFASSGNRPANLKKLVEEVRDFKFFLTISQWQGDMPGWKEPINESEREDLTSYIKTFRNQ